MNPFEPPTIESANTQSESLIASELSTILLIVIPFVANLLLRFQILSTESASTIIGFILLMICIFCKPKAEAVINVHLVLICGSGLILLLRFAHSKSCLFPRLQQLELTNERLTFFMVWCGTSIITVIISRLLTKKR